MNAQDYANIKEFITNEDLRGIKEFLFNMMWNLIRKADYAFQINSLMTYSANWLACATILKNMYYHVCDVEEEKTRLDKGLMRESVEELKKLLCA